jgi:hypothetical protein
MPQLAGVARREILLFRGVRPTLNRRRTNGIIRTG